MEIETVQDKLLKDLIAGVLAGLFLSIQDNLGVDKRRARQIVQEALFSLEEKDYSHGK